MSKESFEEQAKKIKAFWHKNKANKAIVIVLGTLLWPLILLSASAYLYLKFDTPVKRWGSIALLIIITFPITIAWISGMSLSRTQEPNMKSQETAKTNTKTVENEGNCTGPDGKKMWLNKEDCEAFNNAWKNPEQGQENTEQALPTSTPKPGDTYSILSQLGKEVTENSNISVFENDDETIDVVNNIVLTPEIEWGLDAYSRRWVTDYLAKMYTSGLNIRYALITIAFTGIEKDTIRVGLGVNQAKNITQEEWNETNPYDLCHWLKRVSLGENQNDYANSTFTENYECS